MSYGTRTLTISKSIERSTRRKRRKSRGLMAYWAEIGFILLAIMFLQPQWFQSFIAAISSSSAQSVLP